MVTAEEIQSIHLFTTLGSELCERIARLAADVRLADGDYAVHEGEEPALFAVLEGQMETVKLLDGETTAVGVRSPGEVFGEVSLTLGTSHPAGLRAAGKARVMRIEQRDYHELAAKAPAIARTIGALAHSRITGPRGLQGIAAEAPPPRALVVGDRWNPGCTALRRFLHRNQISFKWLAPDTPEAEELWDGPLPPEADQPVLRVIGGKTVVQPRLRRVADLLGLETEPAHAEYDTVVVGAGPAGLAAGVYGASEGLRTVVIEREAPGGQAGTSSRIENYLGFPSGVSGDELSSRALQQARRLGAEILVTRAIERIDASTRRVYLDGGDVIRAKAIILACGVAWRRLELDGFDRLVGKGISYGASRSEAPNAHGLDIHIVGAGNSAGQAALFFSTHARSVKILCRSSSLDRSMSRYLIDQLAARPNIEVLAETELAGVEGDASLEAVHLRSPHAPGPTRHACGGLFIFIGADAVTHWLPPEIALDSRGYVLTGTDVPVSAGWPLERDPYLLETSVPGIFACGDVRSGPVKRVAAAVGEGSMAIAFVHQFLKD
jgi:thioredoxin reductase (NADPH)